MATESPDNSRGESGEADYLTQDAISSQQDTQESVLPKTGAKVEYTVIPPGKFASLIDHYGITDLAKNLEDVDPNADLQQDIDPSDVKDADLDELDEGIAIMLFYRDVILPKITRPEQVHWANPDHINDPNWVDLSELPERDKLHLVACVTGQDPQALVEEAEERAEKFQE